MSSLKLPTLYFQLLAEQLRDAGVSVGDWLALSGLDTEALDRGGTLEVSAKVFRRLVVNAQEMSREPALGLFLGERLVASTHGFVGYAALSSATVGGALEVLERFMEVRASLASMSPARVGDEHHVRFHELEPLGAAKRPVMEALCLSIKNVLDAAAMRTHQVRYVAFDVEAPAYLSLATELFGCQVRHDQTWSGLALPSSALDVPLKMADPLAREEAARICQRELDKIEASASVASRVRRLLLEKQTGFPSLQAVARTLHMTPRTLHRRLVAEGTSFRRLLEAVRHRLAVDHLRSGRFSVEEVGYILGYANTSNFRRAFRRWEARPPSALLRTGQTSRSPSS